MSRRRSDLQGMVYEYRAILTPLLNGKRRRVTQWGQVVGKMEKEADWTARGAVNVTHLVRHYGWFVLRNAAAIAIALDIEDGDMGL